MINLLILLSLIMTFLLLLIIGIGVWWRFIDGTFYRWPIELESSVLQATKTEYKPMELVQARLKFVKNRAIMEQIRWSLVSSVLIEMSPRDIGLPAGKNDFLLDIAQIPQGLALAGQSEKWRFTGYVEYKINPFKVVILPIETTEFSITGE